MGPFSTSIYPSAIQSVSSRLARCLALVPLRDLLVYSMPLIKHLNGSQSQHRSQSFSEVADGADCRGVKVSEGTWGNYGGNCLALAWMCWAGVMKIGAVARDLELMTRRDVAKDADILFFFLFLKSKQNMNEHGNDKKSDRFVDQRSITLIFFFLFFFESVCEPNKNCRCMFGSMVTNMNTLLSKSHYSLGRVALGCSLDVSTLVDSPVTSSLAFWATS